VVVKELDQAREGETGASGEGKCPASCERENRDASEPYRGPRLINKHSIWKAAISLIVLGTG